MPVRILIADPDESFGLMLKQILELNGEYVVDAYSTGAATLASAQKRKPDLVIVDAALVDMSAAALIASLQLIRPGIALMLIPLGNSLPDEFQRLGVRGILTKPFFVGNLGKYIADVMGTDSKPLLAMPPAYGQPPAPQPLGITPSPAATIINKQTGPPGEGRPAPTPPPPQHKADLAPTQSAAPPASTAKAVVPPANVVRPDERQSAPADAKRVVPDAAKPAHAGKTTVSSLAKAAGNLAARIPRPSALAPAEKPVSKPPNQPPAWVAALSQDTSTTEPTAPPLSDKPALPATSSRAAPKAPEANVSPQAATQSAAPAQAKPPPVTPISPGEIQRPAAPQPPGEPPLAAASSSPAPAPRPVIPTPPPEPSRPAIPPRVRQAVTPPRRGLGESDLSRPFMSTPSDPQVAIDRTLAALVRELRADALFVLKNGAPLFERGSVPGVRVEAVASVLQRWAATAAELAALVGETHGRFIQFHAEGERYHVYAFDSGGGLMLVVICRTDIPFGTIRLTLKAAGAELTKLVR